MSIRSGHKSKSNKERDKKRRSRWRSRELQKTLVNKATEQETPAASPDGNQIVSTHLRQLPVDGERGSDQGAGVLEIVAYRTPKKDK
jgi:hypothetical protein